MTSVALTFDDGVSRWTDPLLDILAAHDAHATFFVLGEHVLERPDIVARAFNHGHEIGVHGWNHDRVRQMDKNTLRARLTRTAVLIEQITGVRPRLWRPPWHESDSAARALATRLGLRLVGVDVDAFDTTTIDDDEIIYRVATSMTERAIVGLHDGIAPNGEPGSGTRKPTVDAVDALLAGGLRSVTVSEMLGL